jgi:tetratricopeptide (TPR) repeat protein
LSSKSNTRLTQLLLIIAGVVVISLILIAPERKSDQKRELASEDLHEGHDHAPGEGHDEESSTAEAESLPAEMKVLEEQAEKVADTDTKLNLYDSLINMSIREKRPNLVAKYSKKKAMAVPTETNWMLAGDNYFKAFRLSKNQSKAMLEGAIAAYEKVQEINPDNLDAKTATGVAYVEGAALMGEMPMKGIGILKEVLNIDSENVNAITNLGYFAIQSGQYEKAIERFEKVLQIDPQNAEAYIYLTDVYLSQDKREKGIETLEKYKSMVDDPLVKQQVDEYINEIKTN